jgi:hypothetical protein
MSALKHDPDGVPSGPEAIARARREIAAIKAEIRAGNPDLHGLVDPNVPARMTIYTTLSHQRALNPGTLGSRLSYFVIGGAD